MLKTKKGLIISQVFIYALTLVIIAIILIMGYRYISSTKDTIGKTDLVLLKNKLTNDIESISSDFGSQRKVSYSVPPSTELCLVDLREEIRDDVIVSDLNPLIRDSVESNVKKNAFILGKNLFESYFIGDIEINNPYFKCFNSSAGKINFTIEGLGNRTLI